MIWECSSCGTYNFTWSDILEICDICWCKACGKKNIIDIDEIDDEEFL